MLKRTPPDDLLSEKFLLLFSKSSLLLDDYFICGARERKMGGRGFDQALRVRLGRVRAGGADGGGEGLGGAGVAAIIEVHMVGGEEAVQVGPVAHELVARE